MKPSRTLIGTITQRAERSFPLGLHPGEDFEERWKFWNEHWLKTAEEICRDFRAEGLTETTKAVEGIITWHKGHMK